jgi:hypothetical protein
VGRLYGGDIITLQAIDFGKTKLLRPFNCHPDLSETRERDFGFLNGLDG